MPKAKKKKKRTGEKEKKSKKNNLNERETVSYEQQILDNNRQLARLRSRNKELEEEVEVAREKFRQLEEDRSDVVAHLKRDLEEKLEETRELNEQLTALEELRKEELAVFKKKEEAMDLEYHTMENNLSAEVKLAAGKLNALEDWRLARLDLMQKFENQEKDIASQEERHKNTLYEAEKSLVIGKAMMKKEMEQRLNELSEAFRRATNLRIAEATHRTVRENIALNEELDRLFESYRELEATNKEYKEVDLVLKLQSELFEAESNISLKKVMKQKDVINKLAEDQQRAILRYGGAQRDNLRLAEYQRQSDDCKKRCERLEKKISQMEKCVVDARREKEELNAEMREKNKEFDMLKSILGRARNCIKEALELQEEFPGDTCATHLKQRLLFSLQEILERGDVTDILGYTASQIEGIACRYAQGDLGLVEGPEVSEEKEDDVKEEEEYIQTDVEIETEPLEKDRVSCVLSDISSNVPSPKEITSGSAESVENDD